MNKYNVGDKVRIIDKRGAGWNLDGLMDKWFGKVMTIRKIEPCGAYRMVEDINEGFGNDGWFWSESDFAELVFHKQDNTTVVIRFDGDKTIAELMKNGKKVKTATARRNPMDEYDRGEGAKVAINRLFEEPKYYNGKVVCIKSGYPWWTVGKIYEVKDGIITANDGDKYPHGDREPYRDAEDVRHAGSDRADNFGRHNHRNTFIEIKE